MEVCKNGHPRDGNTSWVKDNSRNRTKRVCLACRRESHVPKGTLRAHEIMRQRTDNAHEDIEDLISFGATYEEIMKRGGYSRWNDLQKSLKRRGRTDLLDALYKKKELV